MKTTFTILAILLGLASFNCKGPNTGEKTATTQDSTFISIGLRRDMDSLNPYLAMSYEAELVFHRLYPTLFNETINTSWGVNLSPNIVDTFKFTEDGLDLTLTLKPNLAWSDGLPLTTADIEYTLTLQKDPGLAWIGNASKEMVESWTIQDDLTMNIHFKSSCQMNLLDLNEGVILPKHYYSKWPLSDWRQVDWPEDMIVFGPYRIQEHLQGEKWVLAPLWAGAPTVGFAIIRDKEMHFQLLKEGKLDYSWTLPVQRFEDINHDLLPSFFPENNFAFIVWNPIDPSALDETTFQDINHLKAALKEHPHPIFSDSRVRQALSLAMNRERLLGTLLPKETTLPGSPWELFSRGLQKGSLHNVLKANLLLDEAGWVLKDGVRQKNGHPLDFEVIVNAGNTQREQILLSLAADLLEVGAKMKVKTMEASLYVQACYDRKFDAAFNVLRVGTHPDLKELFYSTSALDQGFNFASWMSADTMIEELACQTDPERIQTLLAQLHVLFSKEQPMSLLYRGVRMAAFAKTGVSGDPSPLDPLNHLETWKGHARPGPSRPGQSRPGQSRPGPSAQSTPDEP